MTTDAHWDTPDDIKYPDRYVMGHKDISRIDALVEHVDAGGDSDGTWTATVIANSVESYPSGAVRDTPEGKPRYDLIDPILLRRTASHLQLGAEHYGEHNWTKGIPSSRYMASLLRHIEQYRNGERDEDHLAAAVFNIMGLMRNETETYRRPELNDLYDWGK